VPSEPVMPLVGIGTDVHAFAEGRSLWLAGLLWPGETGLAGHSDADVAAHALCDALLSAAGLGDLGSVFGTDDPAWSQASGVSLLSHAAGLVREAGFVIGNASVQVIGHASAVAVRRRRTC
jgi:2-C-methyl-D-erythritol 2,4-cyclodiphosphate synthase